MLDEIIDYLENVPPMKFLLHFFLMGTFASVVALSIVYFLVIKR